MHSMFNIQDFQAASKTGYYSVSHFNLQGDTILSVRLHCKKFALKKDFFIRRYRRDPAFGSTVSATEM